MVKNDLAMRCTQESFWRYRIVRIIINWIIKQYYAKTVVFSYEKAEIYADKMCNNCTADQCLCFCFTNSTIFFLKSASILAGRVGLTFVSDRQMWSCCYLFYLKCFIYLFIRNFMTYLKVSLPCTHRPFSKATS